MRTDIDENNSALFEDATDALTQAAPCTSVAVTDGGELDLVIAPVRNQIGSATVRMLAYDGSIPGPTLRVREGARIRVNVANDTDVEQTVHWHGLRLDNRYDGVPHETQAPIRPGARFGYELTFPDPGLYWYHPHFREDYGQEMGLYGNIVVEPADPEYWPPADEELVVTLDDVLLTDGHVAPFQRSGPTHTMMGRFGNVMLVAGQVSPAFPVRAGSVVRLFLTNTANVRVFNLVIDGAQMKVVGGDSGRVEREEFVDEVLLAPSERAIVDVLFSEPGRRQLSNRMPQDVVALAAFDVADGAPSPAASRFHTLRTDASLTAEREGLPGALQREPDYTLRFVGTMDMGDMDMDMDMDAMDMADSHGADEPAAHHDGPGDGIEWEDEMPEMNTMSDNANMAWQLIDGATGAVNDDIDWALTVGERVKIRLDNNAGGDHLMHHPFHIHGAGRFLVLQRGGVEEPNLAWKDTVLVRGGEVVDILFDVTNPGRWMAHCHIAEHTENGMMFNFEVLPEGA